MAKIDILLATFNGAEYIETQILSIIAQTYKDWRLIIHDDGSKDETVQIVRRFQKADTRILFIEDGVNHLGAAKHFLHLLKFSDGDYCMFCDQDDVWFDNKIELSFQRIQKENNQLPQVVYVDSYVWIPQRGIKGTATLAFPSQIKEFVFLNGGVRGCVSIFNAMLRSKMMEWEGDCAMHDHLLLLYALVFGEAHYLKTPLMLYRNHGKNVTGETDLSIFDLKRLKNNQRISVVDRMHYQTIAKFYYKYKDVIKKEKRDEIQTYIEMVNMGLCKKIGAVLNNRFSIYNSKLLLLLKIGIRPYIN